MTLLRLLFYYSGLICLNFSSLGFLIFKTFPHPKCYWQSQTRIKRNILKIIILSLCTNIRNRHIGEGLYVYIYKNLVFKNKELPRVEKFVDLKTRFLDTKLLLYFKKLFHLELGAVLTSFTDTC